MRSRYLPDGSVDYEADRMLEILRHADAELERQQREQAQAMASYQQGGPRPKRKRVTTPQDAANAEWQFEHLTSFPEALVEGIFDGGSDLALPPEVNALFSDQHPNHINKP